MKFEREFILLRGKQKSAPPAVAGMFDGVASPSTRRKTKPNSGLVSTTALNFDDPSTYEYLLSQFIYSYDRLVPVYDGRSVSFTFGKDLSRLRELLPTWEGEIPVGSFAVVGYTSSTFTNSSSIVSLSCNIQFVVILGTPSND